MLSPQQLNDIRIGYSDSALGLTDYQKYKKQQISNSIYKEYLIYRAKIKIKMNICHLVNLPRQSIILLWMNQN